MRFDLIRRNRNNIVPKEVLRELSSGTNTFLYGSINATFEYYAAIELGKSPQLFTVQVDTGSSTLAVPANGCQLYDSDYQATGQDCTSADAFYNFASSSYVPCDGKCLCQSSSGDCLFSVMYGDGSFLEGPLVVDQFSIAGLSTSLTFGAILAESASFTGSSVDGIMGIAYSALSPEDGDSVMDKLVAAGQIENSFSMCLGYLGGVFTLGGVDESFSNGNMTYTPITKETYYVVELDDILVGGQSVNLNVSNLNGPHTIVDSGTTLLILNSPAFNSVVNLLMQNCPAELSTLCNQILTSENCFAISRESVMKFPAIQFKLKDATPLSIGPDMYFLQILSDDTELYCFGIVNGTDLGTILGDVFMQAFNVHFDRANTRIGFAPVVNCTEPAVGLQLNAGDQQSGQVGWSMDPIEVKVQYDVSKASVPAVGLIVQFEVTSGKADLSASRAGTDSNGIASIVVTPKSVGAIEITATLLGTSSAVTFHVKGLLLGTIGIVLVCLAVAVCIGVIVAVVIIRRRRRLRHHDNHEQKNGLLTDIQ